MDYTPRDIEHKWQERWAERGRYEADPDDEDATFVTVPYPYPSGGMHIGHARTYTVPDVYARYRRLQGDNVLFPLGWHVTGTPIVGAVNRLQKGEEEQLSVLRDTYGVPEDELESLETPMGYARYFIENHYKKNMQSLGLSIDWRREFTTNDDRYSKFITWQYQTLRDRGRLEKGLHPVKYCTEEENPVTTHDILEGEEAEFQEYTLIKFDHEGRTIPMATLRPETVRGVTNAFILPDGEYVEATVDGEDWIVSRAAVEKLELQHRGVTVNRKIDGKTLVGETVTNPVTEESVRILPATFVDPENATGVVMSVPGHSPDDWVALEEAKADTDRLESYGIDPETVQEIEPQSIIDVEGYGEFPAKDAVEAFEIRNQDDPALEEATQEVYNREFHAGQLKEMYNEYAGEIIEEVREELDEHFQSQGAFDSMHEFSEEVVCRCGGAVEVAKQDTWFLSYSDEDWKAETRKIVDSMDAIPENTREQYYHTIDWLNEWPAIRNYGLGTRLPWDDDFVIEPLSDSTIYMAYYTIAHRIEDVPVDALTRDFFDTLFYGAEAVENPDERALELREEWDYWYPVDYRCSANDLISNHLSFYLFHHAELFEESQWPEGITIMGMGLLEGTKMSSSKGHVVLPTEAIEEYGADTVRFFLLNSAEPWQDYDWRAEDVQGTRDQLSGFWRRARAVIQTDIPDTQPDLDRIDRWLLSKLQGIIQDVTEAMEGFSTRHASQDAFFQLEEVLRWYRKRTDLDRPGARWTRAEVLRTRLRLLAPIIPFMTNELHEQLVGKPVEDTSWPEPDLALQNDVIENEEEFVEGVYDDVRDIVDVTGTDPETIRLFLAADWKHQVFESVLEVGPDQGGAMRQVMEDPELRERGEAVNDLVGSLVETVRERSGETLDAMAEINEWALYEEAAAFIESEYDATVEVVSETEVDAEKAGQAEPFRPAILLE
ncbi:leucine--tRNA ligase [Halodesulfurarchaeum sp.]|uniref:leucine--tRNA ligase n=1 Tax=Halodesulfurarchaeum sp. TaxID=1980530 RepID=UPI002FC2F7C1